MFEVSWAFGKMWSIRGTKLLSDTFLTVLAFSVLIIEGKIWYQNIFVAPLFRANRALVTLFLSGSRKKVFYIVHIHRRSI